MYQVILKTYAFQCYTNTVYIHIFILLSNKSVKYAYEIRIQMVYQWISGMSRIRESRMSQLENRGKNSRVLYRRSFRNHIYIRERKICYFYFTISVYLHNYIYILFCAFSIHRLLSNNSIVYRKIYNLHEVKNSYNKQ